MRKYLFLIAAVSMLLLNNCNAGNPGKTGSDKNPAGSVITLTNEIFKEIIFDYDVNKEWKYKGDKPAIIDFYASWCGPCRMMSPIVEDIAKEYSGKINVYKVNVDTERELAANMGIQSLPTLLFIPLNGQPQATMGYMPKESLVNVVTEVLFSK